jgi:hypothetical protein
MERARDAGGQFDTPQEASEFFASKEFEGNPIGVDFDPEELIERLRSGEDETSIKKRKNIGVRQGIPGW